MRMKADSADIYLSLPLSSPQNRREHTYVRMGQLLHRLTSLWQERWIRSRSRLNKNEGSLYERR